MMGDPSKLRVILKVDSLVRVRPTLVLSWAEKTERRKKQAGKENCLLGKKRSVVVVYTVCLL